MNKDEVEGKAKQVKGSVKEHGGKAMDSDKTEVEGKAEKTEGKVQEKYGEAKEQLKK